MLFIKSGLLVRVFAVAHGFGFDELQVKGAGKTLAPITKLLAEVVGNRAVIMRRMFISFDSQIKASFVSNGVVVGVELFYQAGIIAGVDDDGHVTVILCSSTNHGGSADIDIFNSIFEATVWASNGCLEGIQINHNHIDRGNIMAGHNTIVSTATP